MFTWSKVNPTVLNGANEKCFWKERKMSPYERKKINRHHCKNTVAHSKCGNISSPAIADHLLLQPVPFCCCSSKLLLKVKVTQDGSRRRMAWHCPTAKRRKLLCKGVHFELVYMRTQLSLQSEYYNFFLHMQWKIARSLGDPQNIPDPADVLETVLTGVIQDPEWGSDGSTNLWVPTLAQ